MTLQTLTAGWEQFRERVMPPDVSEVQLREMRRSFYAGVQWMVAINFDIGGDDITQDMGILHLELIREELNAFYVGMKAGKN
jgi:hypothetical protein